MQPEIKSVESNLEKWKRTQIRKDYDADRLIYSKDPLKVIKWTPQSARTSLLSSKFWPNLVVVEYKHGTYLYYDVAIYNNIEYPDQYINKLKGKPEIVACHKITLEDYLKKVFMM